ncbi:MAG TPA: Gfo/Idh/MocA family oxidoreductase [Bacteroidales bacterium]|jgi:predicted dehydrogenase|nr:Gfo/Idh/MocA family oxidoreductase [Bacteroidales bacterium]
MINWGIIGCGNVTEVKSGPAFSKVKDSRLVAVMRRNAALAEDYAKRHNVPRFYSNASDLINDKEVDAVYVATPPGSHAEFAIQVLKAGKPVYIEKPMALNYAECTKINEASEKYRLPVFVAYYRRALPGFLLVKKMIAEGRIGKVKFVQMQLFKYASADEKVGKLPWRVDPAQSGGGHFFDLASHQLDWMDYVFGPVQKVTSIALNHGGLYEPEDFITAAFLFPEQVVVTGTWSFTVSPESNRDSIEIFGSEGSIKFSTFDFVPIVVTTPAGQQVYENERPDHVQYYLIDKIVQALHGRGESPSTGITAARTSRVMDEVVREYYKE